MNPVIIKQFHEERLAVDVYLAGSSYGHEYFGEVCGFDGERPVDEDELGGHVVRGCYAGVRLPLRNERYHSAFLRGLRRKIGEAGDKGPDTLLIDRLAPAGAVFRIFFGTAIFVDERLRNQIGRASCRERVCQYV